MIKNRIGLRTLVVGLGMLLTPVAVSAAATPALADGGGPSGTFNNANVQILGGSARALSACVVIAKTKIKHHLPPSGNNCSGFAVATGGTVNLKNVGIEVVQLGGGRITSNRATVDIEGGDAEAVAACVNFLQGSASASQKNTCDNTAVATGGDVNLQNVTISIIQSG